MGGNGYRLAELIDVARLQRLCDGLSAVSGTVLAVLDPDGDGTGRLRLAGHLHGVPSRQRDVRRGLPGE